MLVKFSCPTSQDTCFSENGIDKLYGVAVGGCPTRTSDHSEQTEQNTATTPYPFEHMATTPYPFEHMAENTATTPYPFEHMAEVSIAARAQNLYSFHAKCLIRLMCMQQRRQQRNTAGRRVSTSLPWPQMHVRACACACACAFWPASTGGEAALLAGLSS